MDVRYLILLFLLVACLPQSQVSQGNLSGDSTSTNPNSNSTTSTIPESPTQWNFLGDLSTTITVNASNLNNAYITGKDVELFLNTSGNFSEDYCLVSRYSLNGLKYELRTRVVPISFYDFTAKRTVKILRADFNDLSNSQSICSTAPLMVVDANGGFVADTTMVSHSTYDPSQLCSNCSNVLASGTILLFKKTPLDLKQLTGAQINLSTLALSVNPNNISTNNSGTCSKSQCIARGFDCCLDNQCITDGSVRPTATTLYSSQLQAAEQERFNNPLAYLNYPQLYYICGASVPNTSTGQTSGSYEQGLTQLKKDYFCVEHMKKYKTGATFHQDLLTGLNFFPDDLDIPDIANNPSTLYPTDIECRNNADPTSNMNYLNVAKRLYQNCGCSKTTLNDMVAFCPAYEYSVNYFESSGLPNRIDCYTPPVISQAVPLQQTVSVNSRSAPHRFFSGCGDEYSSSTTCSGNATQEGDAFSYLDEGKVLPSQETFGMNSILGQMNVTLDKALPAKMVKIELDQVYQISTISGFYSPCPTCNKDSWFSSFSAYPTSAYGSGLQAVGHSTTRDGFDYNTTGGNYEDTIFGRACWIPPTMIPFSHKAYSDVQTQRLERLKTQAALYANGYQRDWFGFNKGALIGSFDGVTWFAVGKGRIVRSTSTKLFLAINAPFADLANPTLHVVNVQAYDGITQAAQVDYDPQYHNYHPYQNEAGNCQSNHMCSTDTDCITRLGWEYMCADVQTTKTLLPEFDSEAKEKAGVATAVTIDQILAQKRFPSSSTKRCVYRGSGSLCAQNLTAIADLNLRKKLSCAPNFYCANVSSSAAFNSKVSRYASNLEDLPVANNHFFGKDANVLGRPLSYVASSLTTSLPNDIRLALTQNMAQNTTTSNGYTGLCLPGKALPETTTQLTMYNPYEQLKTPDPSLRSDFISQIGSCNAGLFSNYRYSSCPVVGPEGNYEFLTSTFSLTGYQDRARNQNSCGLDSLYKNISLNNSADNLLSVSPFKSIESKPLNLQTAIEPTFARDACLRRAGQVCHTDLDCGPNKLHADQASNYNTDYFGNEAEKKYYSEYLVCGQGDAKPSPLDSLKYKAFNMNKNRCCREIGSDLTTYTSFIPTNVNPNSSSNTNSTTTDDTYDKVSFGLKTTLAPGLAPNDPLRYSRLATVENLGTASRPGLTAFQDKSGSSLTSAYGSNVMTPYQWKTLSEANSESCCGGGWIRKFSDGSNDWSKRDRVYIDVKNFACINSTTTLLTKPEDVSFDYNFVGEATSLSNQDRSSYCKNSTTLTNGTCAQYTISDDLAEIAQSSDPIIYPTGSDTSHYKTYGIDFTVMRDFYFYPKSTDADSEIIIQNGKTSGRRNISVKLPSFISRSWDNNISSLADGNATKWAPAARVHMYEISNETTEYYPCVKKSSLLTTLISPTTDGTGQCSTSDGDHCCYAFDSTTRTVKVVPAIDGNFNPSQTSKKMGVKFINAYTAGSWSNNRKKPGSNTYYLQRLGKLELTGIPQISYNPITCSDNSDRIVPGLFKKSGVTDMKVSDFTDPTYSFQQSLTDPDTSITTNSYYTNRYGLDHEPVFSENDFKCCTPLGKTTSDETKCCSGHGVQAPNTNTFTCSLPAGTDLMVYFNRFVSNEAVGTDKPGGGLVDADYNFLTGEPRLTSDVNIKISKLGQAYCDSKKVRQGGAFGEFPLEPVGNNTNLSDKIYGIVDSSNDEGKLSNAGTSVAVGYSAFMLGFRWNHHLYCQD